MTNATTPNASKDWPIALSDFACGIACTRAFKKFLIVFRGSAFHNLRNSSHCQSAFSNCRASFCTDFCESCLSAFNCACTKRAAKGLNTWGRNESKLNREIAIERKSPPDRKARPYHLAQSKRPLARSKSAVRCVKFVRRCSHRYSHAP